MPCTSLGARPRRTIGIGCKRRACLPSAPLVGPSGLGCAPLTCCSRCFGANWCLLARRLECAPLAHLARVSSSGLHRMRSRPVRCSLEPIRAASARRVRASLGSRTPCPSASECPPSPLTRPPSSALQLGDLAGAVGMAIALLTRSTSRRVQELAGGPFPSRLPEGFPAGMNAYSQVQQTQAIQVPGGLLQALTSLFVLVGADDVGERCTALEACDSSHCSSLTTLRRRAQQVIGKHRLPAAGCWLAAPLLRGARFEFEKPARRSATRPSSSTTGSCSPSWRLPRHGC